MFTLKNIISKSDLKGTSLYLNKSKIVWPGNSRKKPDGTKWSSKLKVVVIEEKPFIFKTPKITNKKCTEILNNSVDCPWSFSKPSTTINMIIFSIFIKF